MGDLIFIDTEVGLNSQTIKDFGAISQDGKKLHTSKKEDFLTFIDGASFLCGHNIVKHDVKYIEHLGKNIDTDKLIDTLLLSTLLFPKKPYHKLIKDDKLFTEQLNNPLNDAIQAKHLFYDEVDAFLSLDVSSKIIYKSLLGRIPGFSGFFHYLRYEKKSKKSLFSLSRLQNRNNPNQENKIETLGVSDLVELIKIEYNGLICDQADVGKLVDNYPVELAYVLALIKADDEYSILAKWVLYAYPQVQSVLYLLRNKSCLSGCKYCDKALDPIVGLKKYFGYDAYRKFDGEALQEKAVTAAIHHKSLLAIFPTGGGKSITFQIPALMAGKATGGLTLVISPLQSLMKDQVDNLEAKGITDSVTINGLLDPIERSKAFERVQDGSAKILYISPESLRSKSIERLLLARKIERFVIDEAHCFSAWGQDFRVDYLYIGEFIKNLYEKKQLDEMIPVSCFTATAKQKVVMDIKAYFKENLDINLELFSASAARKNLKYKVIECTSEEKYDQLRLLIEQKKCPTIVYVSRTRKTQELADRLTKDGYLAKAYHGKMNKQVKSENQELFTRGQVDIMVATSAFGMGVDKSDVGLVIHYQISNSLENYVQEAGRAGRDQSIEAECFVLFDDEDLNDHFSLLNQTKLNIEEIGQVWKAIKDITRYRDKVSQSALEIARKAGWDDGINDIETKVRTAISALEQAGYIKRGQNMPRVYADSILAESVANAAKKIRSSRKFKDDDRELAVRIIAKLIGERSRKIYDNEVPESRIDYISDQLAIRKEDVLRIIGLLKEEEILADAKDLTAFVNDDMTRQKALNQLKWHQELEQFLLDIITDDGVINLKELNERAEEIGLKKVSTDKIITILNFWAIKHIIMKETSKQSRNHIRLAYKKDRVAILSGFLKRVKIASFILYYLYEKYESEEETRDFVEFSVLELKKEYIENSGLKKSIHMKDIEDALFYLSRVGALKIEGGFLVLYNALSIERIEKDNRIQYKIDDYKKLKTFYDQKAHQIHIVGEYARKMLEDYQAALRFVDDYFSLNYQIFVKKYFKGSRGEEITKNITPGKFRQLFGELSPAQLSIVNDRDSKFIVVAAGPGSGKTRILVHKLAALLLMEDVKHEQLLMVTFSRAAATEFKVRLKELIGNSANYVEIKTFHSFCFDILGRVGDIEKSENIVHETARLIYDGQVEQSRITKSVMVIDEAQDMDKHEFNLVRAMTKQNPNMRIIAVGDDDQNIYEFRGSSSEYMKKMSKTKHSKFYELVENYRSKGGLVEFTNRYVERITDRMKKVPIIPKVPQGGCVEVIYYAYDNIMDGVISKLSKEGVKGSVCVLTTTNDEALQMNGRLNDAGYRAKLIQNNDHIRIKDMDEIRFFIRELKISDQVHTIDEKAWEMAKLQLFNKYSNSDNYSFCKKLIEDFEATSGKSKYVSDFIYFIRESKALDFVQLDYDTIQVSTMHKSKGREFDTVIIVLDNFKESSDERRRMLYVAMTRAKESLQIHGRDSGFLRGLILEAGDKTQYASSGNYSSNRGSNRASKIAEDRVYYGAGKPTASKSSIVTFKENKNPYRSKGNLLIQLHYQDVFLSGFYKEHILRNVEHIQSGDRLELKESGCYLVGGGQVLLFSNGFKEKLKNYLAKGYSLLDAKVRMVMYWKAEDKEEEVRVVLPVIRLAEGTSA